MSFYVIPKSAKAIYDMPFEEYKALDRRNQSYFKTLLQKSPMHAEHELANPRKSTREMDWGTVLHASLFGEIDPVRDIHELKAARRTQSAVDAVLDAVGDRDAIVMKPHEKQAVLDAYNSIPSNVRQECQEAKCEVTILFDIHVLDSDIVIPAKARIDILLPWAIRDFKTTSKGITENEFKRMIGTYFYDMQAEFYKLAVFALTGDNLPFQWLVQESSTPYDIAGYEASEDNLVNGKSWLNDAVRIYADCLESGYFKKTWGGEFNEIDSPDWHLFEPKIDTNGIKEVATL